MLIIGETGYKKKKKQTNMKLFTDKMIKYLGFAQNNQG